MKFLIVFACALAAASAGYIAAPVVYGAQHLPVIGPNGVPIDTAEVQHARAAHYAHKVEAHARNGDYAVAHAVAPIVASPVVSAYAHHGVVAHSAPVVSAYAHHGLAAYPTTAVLPSSVNGVPLETPEVVAAKINHFAAHNEALARTAHAVHYRKRRGIYAPVAYASPLAYSAPVVASSYAHASPLVAPVVASAYSHVAPVVSSTYHGSYAAPYYSGAYGHYY